MGGQEKTWDEQVDDALVERLIVALQRAVAAEVIATEPPEGWTPLPAPELTVALLNVLASVLEPAPECRTPMGMRRTAEAAGRHLLVLMRGCRELTRPPEGGAVH